MVKAVADNMSNRQAGTITRYLGHAACVAAAIALLVCLPLTTGCSDAKSTAEGLVVKGDLAAAEVIYEEVLASDPGDLEALSGLSVVLTLQGKHNEARPIQERVIAADPTDVQTRIELGFNYLKHQNRHDDAVRVLGEAAALDASAKNLTFLGQAQAVAGEKDAAEQTLRRALQVDPQYAYSYDVLIGLLEEEIRHADANEVRDLAASMGVEVESARQSP
jgi:tetratricopeptide (TPR) repeat protein